MEVDTENVAMDDSDALMRTDDGGGVINSNIDDDDGAPTVEETYEITTTRRKTIRTSYKIQERVVYSGYYSYHLVIPYDGFGRRVMLYRYISRYLAQTQIISEIHKIASSRSICAWCNVFSARRSDEREDPLSRLSSHVRQTAAILRHCQDDDFRTGNELASSAETTVGNVSRGKTFTRKGREIIWILLDEDKNEGDARFNDFLSVNSRPFASPIESQPRDADPLLLVFTPVRLSRRGFVVPFDSVISSELWASFNHSYEKYGFYQDKRNLRKSKIVFLLSHVFKIKEYIFLIFSDVTKRRYQKDSFKSAYGVENLNRVTFNLIILDNLVKSLEKLDPPSREARPRGARVKVVLNARVAARGTPIVRGDTATRHRVSPKTGERRSPNLNAIREVGRGRADDPREAGAARVDGLLCPRRQRAL
ncbi:hypothetical protein ALC62_00498 [Cyphomyrmex costatus]|uniref:Uncharacterized protein n=1 Tax=Cyphomyrmex costatus TaxID=456900 RepID=A0A195D7T2_9HYME|nr:hypothetical protein ALC62_00498 [Cyphomyrmex costatus]